MTLVVPPSSARISRRLAGKEGAEQVGHILGRSRAAGVLRLLMAAVVICAAGATYLAAAWATADPSARVLWVTDGDVRAVTRSGSHIFIGGNFTRVMERRGGAIELDTSTGSARDPFPYVAGGVVRTIVKDGAGGWFVGGSFDHVDGAPRARLAHILASGLLDTGWQADINGGSVWELLLDGPTLYVAGGFTSIGSVSRTNLAAVSAATGAVDAVFMPHPDLAVLSLARSGSLLYAGGQFGTVGGTVRDHLAAFDATTGTLDPTFDPPEFLSDVDDVTVGNSRVYIAGGFGAMALDPTTGAADTGWHPWLGEVDSIAVSGSAVYVGGSFDTVRDTTGNWTPRNNAAALDASTAAVLPWNPNPDRPVATIAVQGASVYLGGDFKSVGGTARTALARVDATTGTPDSWNPRPNNAGGAIAVSGSNAVIGGSTGVGGVARVGLAALDASTGAVDPGWVADVNATGGVGHLAVLGSRLYVGGEFSSINGTARANLAAVSTAIGAVDPWSSTLPFAWGVQTLYADGGRIYAGDRSDAEIGYAQAKIYALDPSTGGAVSGWTPPTAKSDFNLASSTAQLFQLAASPCRLYAGGSFSSVNGIIRDGFAMFELPGGALSPLALVNASGSFGVALSGSTLFVSGSFLLSGAHTTVAAIDLQANALLWSRADISSVSSMAITDQGLVVGGGFDNVGGVARHALALLDPATGTLQPWAPDVLDAVNRVDVSGGQLNVAGRYAGTSRIAATAFDGFGPAAAPAAIGCPPPTGSGSGGGGSGGGGGGGGGGSGHLDLSVAVAASAAQVEPGANVSYLITVTDLTADPANDLIATISLPTGTQVVSTYSERGSGCAVVAESPSVRCDLNYLSNDSLVGRITIVLKLNTSGLNVLTANAAARQIELNTANNSASATVQVGAVAPKPSPIPTPTSQPAKGKTVTGTSGPNILFGGVGNDVLYARDGERDRLDCGAGRDVAYVDKIDTVAHCEQVHRHA
jgi:hypothetical protein